MNDLNLNKMTKISPQDIAEVVREKYGSIGASVASFGKSSLTVQLPADVVGASDLFVEIAAMNGVIDIEKSSGGIKLLVNILDEPDTEPPKKLNQRKCNFVLLSLLGLGLVVLFFAARQFLLLSARPTPSQSYHFDM